jgi:hypothetical protein
VSRGYRGHHDPDGTRHGGLPTFPWRIAPAGLATRRQLAALGLRPGGQPIVGQVCWTSRRYSGRRQSRTRFAYLYRVDLAAARREPSVAQLVALAKADAARRTCPICRQLAAYVIPRSLGECLDCAERASTSTRLAGEHAGRELRSAA